MPPIGETVEGVVRDCLEQLEDAPWESVDGLSEHLAEMTEDFGKGIERQMEAIDVGGLAERVERMVEGQLEHMHDEMAHDHEHGDHEHEEHGHDHDDHEHDHEGHQIDGHQIEIEIGGGEDMAPEIKQEIMRSIRQQLESQLKPVLREAAEQQSRVAEKDKDAIEFDRSNPEELELAAEIERLQAEKDRLLGKNTRLKKLREKVESLRAEVEKLRKENEDLDDELHGDID